MLAEAPAAQETARCVYQEATAEAVPGPAAALLERLAFERSDRPWFAFYLGHVRWSDPAQARDAYLRSAEGFLRAGDYENELMARVNLLTQYERLTRTREAEKEVARIREIARSSSSVKIRAWGRIVYARHLIDRGRDLDRAYEILRTVELPPASDDIYFLHRDRLFFLGKICQLIGRLDEARGAYARLAELAAAKGDRYTHGNVLYNLATVAYEELREAPGDGKRVAAVRAAREAWEATSGQEHPDRAAAAWLLGELIPGEEGRLFLDRCFELAESDSVRSHCLNPIAGRVSVTDPRAARELVERSRRLATASDDPWAEARAWQRTMQVEWAIGPQERAVAVAWRALDEVEKLRSEQRQGSFVQAGVFSIWSDDYAWLAGSALNAAGRTLAPELAQETAFRAAERLRARALADWLRSADTELGEAVRAAPPDLEEMKAALAPNEAMLSFLIAPWEDLLGEFAGGSWVLAVTRGGVTVHRLPGRVEVRNGVRHLEAAIAGRSAASSRARESAARLHSDLLAEALAGLPPDIDRLILVPDDALHRLPFAALRASEDAEPLGARYELAQVPSATLWLRWRGAEPEPAEQPLLVLADPDLPRGEDTDESPLQVAQTREAAETYDPLPWARSEGKAAKRALGGGTLLFGAKASEAALRAVAPGECEIVHLGTHAVTNEDRPEHSAVLLAPSPEDGRPAVRREEGGDTEQDPGDGYLRSAEIARLDLSGLTVVLASCRSAGGSTLRGEGVMSLARAFFQAGAHGVVASLWPLRDDESAAMFERFYDHLGRGESVAGALRSARREAIAAGEPAAAWAGLVVLGDGAAVPLPGGRRLLDHPALPVVVPALLVLAVVLLAGFAVRGRSADPTA